MIEFPQIHVLLGVAAIIGVLSTYPYVATAIAYRQRDNGLAYLLLVMGVGIWNGMFVAQLLDTVPLVKGFFFVLAEVGALLTGLGWFLFASTASSTPRLPNQQQIYGAAAVLVGLDITLTVTNPIHRLFWSISDIPSPFAIISPNFGYWLHTELLVILFTSGTLLFAAAWRRGVKVRYSRYYTLVGTATIIGILASNILVPGGASVASLVVVGITTVGWIQARRGRVFHFIMNWSV